MTRQLPLPFCHAPQFDRAAVLQAPSNQQALAWLERKADWPQQRLALWGQAGCGKSHLLHRWSRRHGALLVDGGSLDGEPPAGPVAIDDADLAAERPLLHLLNAAAEAGYPVLLASRAAPARWATGLPDLASRLRALLAVEIRPAEEELLRSLLLALLSQRQLAVTPPVQAFLLTHLPREPAALREATARLDRLALAEGGRVTRALAAAVVEELDAEATRPRDREDLPWPVAAVSPDGPGFL